MSLKQGDWKMNESGVEQTLTIAVGGIGQVTGAITPPGAASIPLAGLWDETSRTLTFALLFAGPQGAPQPLPQRSYKGFLFSTPRNPEPGQDVIWTLTGFIQTNDPETAVEFGGNARRNVFGWFAQVTEVG